MQLLLKTLCGCSRTVDACEVYTPHSWFVPLRGVDKAKFHEGTVPLDVPCQREFKLADTHVDEYGVPTHIYEEVS